MLIFKKTKDFLKKYWELVVGAIILALGYVLGTSGNREKVLESDIKAHKKKQKIVNKETDRAIEEFKNAQDEAHRQKLDREEAADQNKIETKKDLLKDEEELDKILKEKYKLDGE